jgi:DNA-binding NarL/FixJ family response regulator
MSPTATARTGSRSLLAELTALRVHVRSDEPVVRMGIQSLLESRCATLAFVEDLTEQDADVVFFDVIGLHLNQGTDLEDVVAHYPGRVLALSRTLQPGLTARALALGAVAAVPLGACADELVAAIHDLFEGRFGDGSPADLANQRDRDHRLGHDASLSPRELEVLYLIVAGASNPEIGAALNITTNTVKTYVRHTYAKIGVSTRSQAVAWGVEHGIPTQPIA